MLFLYAYQLPSFRTSQLLAGIAVLVPLLVYLPLVWVADRRTQVILASAGILVDLSRVDYIAINLLGRFGRWREQGTSRGGSESGSRSDADRERMGLLSMPKLKEDIRLPGTSQSSEPV